MARPTSFSSVLLNLYEVGVTGGILYVNGVPQNAYVHLTGNELIGGNKSFTGQIFSTQKITVPTGEFHRLYRTGYNANGPQLVWDLTGQILYANHVEPDAGATALVGVIDLYNNQLSGMNGGFIDWKNGFAQSRDSGRVMSYESGQLLWNSLATLDWTGRQLLYGWQADTLQAIGGGSMVNIVGSQLINAASITTLDWGAYTLYNFGGTPKMDWSNGYMYDNSVVMSLDWTNRWLYDGNSQTALDWNLRQMIDSGNVRALNWSGRALYGLTGGLAVNWNSGRLYNTNQTIAVDWKNQQLSGAAWSTNTFATQPLHIVTKQVLDIATGSLPATFDLRYVLTGQTGAFITTNQTGNFVGVNQTGNFVTTNQTGNFVTTSQTGQFYPTGYVIAKVFEATGQMFSSSSSSLISGFSFTINPSEGWLVKMFVQISGSGAFPLQVGLNYLYSGSLFRQTCFGTANSVSNFNSDTRLTPGLSSSSYATFAGSGPWIELDATVTNGTPNALVVTGIAALGSSGAGNFKCVMSGSYFSAQRYK